MKSIIPEIYVTNCKEALDFYKEAFGGGVRNVRTADNIEMFKGHEGKIIHSELHINPNCVLYLVDIMGKEAEGNNIHMVLEMDS